MSRSPESPALDDDDFDRPLTAEEIAAQDEQRAQLQRRFVQLAASDRVDTQMSDDALNGLSINREQFKQLLRSHIAAASGEETSEDDPAMEAELDGLWLELPKFGADKGVTFPSLLLALAGGGPSSQHGSRRASISQGGGAVAAEFDPFSPTASGNMLSPPPVAGMPPRRKSSVSGVRSPPGAAGGGEAQAEMLRTMFNPVRRGSQKLPFGSAGGSTPGIPVPRTKRYSEMHRNVGALLSPTGLGAAAAAAAAAGNNSGGADRPRAHTLLPDVHSPPTPSPITTGSVPSAVPLQQRKAAPSLAAAPSSRASATTSVPTPFDDEPESASSSVLSPSPSSSALGPASSASAAGGWLDLSDPDWKDLSWLVAAHPAAFSSATSSPSSSSSQAQQTRVDPLRSPSTTLVSASALQIAVQHYLSRWLNQHELNVIASMLKFVKGTGAAAAAATSSGGASSSSHTPPLSPSSGGASSPSSDLLTLETLSKAISALHDQIQQQYPSPMASTAVIDPLPAFAQAFGLLPSPASSSSSPAAAAVKSSPVANQLSTEEILRNLSSFQVLAPALSLSLLRSFGPEFLHAPAVQTLLADMKNIKTRHALLEKEHGLLSASRENLDSSHQDLSEQIPYLQAALETARKEKLAMAAENARAIEIEQSNRTLKMNHDAMQKKCQQLQEDLALLREESLHSKEVARTSEEEHVKLAMKANKLKEKMAQYESKIQQQQDQTQRQQAQDQHTSVLTLPIHRTHNAKNKLLYCYVIGYFAAAAFAHMACSFCLCFCLFISSSLSSVLLLLL